MSIRSTKKRKKRHNKLLEYKKNINFFFSLLDVGDVYEVLCDHSWWFEEIFKKPYKDFSVRSRLIKRYFLRIENINLDKKQINGSTHTSLPTVGDKRIPTEYKLHNSKLEGKFGWHWFYIPLKPRKYKVILRYIERNALPHLGRDLFLYILEFLEDIYTPIQEVKEEEIEIEKEIVPSEYVLNLD